MQSRPISVILVGLIILVALGISGCSSSEKHSEHTSMLPEFATDAVVGFTDVPQTDQCVLLPDLGGLHHDY